MSQRGRGVAESATETAVEKGPAEPRRPSPDRPAAQRAIEAFLRAVGAPLGTDPELDGTGARVTDAFVDDFLSGYAMDPARVLADGTASSSPAMVLLVDLGATTMCPHHLLPASGVVHVGYWPNERVAGFGAVAALVDGYTRRLALQEDIARNVAHALVEHLGARAAGCVVDLTPTCATARGERRHGMRAITSSFAGAAEHDAGLRAELLTTLAVSGVATRVGGEPEGTRSGGTGGAKRGEPDR
jgi:GTP cyclohydrolase IA